MEGDGEYKVQYLDNEDEEPYNWIKRAGRVRITYKNGDIFEGIVDELKNKEGFGTYAWMGPGEEDDSLVQLSKYEGNFKLGLRNGVGKMTFPNGDIYEGEWVDNLMTGEGSYIYSQTKDIYSGTWKDGKKDGFGRYEYQSNSSILVGTWAKGKFQTGKWEMKNYGVYEGNFKMGKPIGPGKFSYENGYSQFGSFEVTSGGDKDDENKKDEGEDNENEEKPADTLETDFEVTWVGENIVCM